MSDRDLDDLLISYLMMIDGPGNELYWNGWYQDVYVKTPKGWRFKSRNHVGGGRVGVPADLGAARFLWEREPTPAGSRSLVGKAPARGGGAGLAGDPLKWLASGEPSMPPGSRRSWCGRARAGDARQVTRAVSHATPLNGASAAQA